MGHVALWFWKRGLLRRTWQEPYLADSAVVMESDDWGPGDDEHGNRLSATRRATNSMRRGTDTKSDKSTTAGRRVLYVENGIGYGGAIICLRHLVRHLDRCRYRPMVITGRTGPLYREIASEVIWKHIPDRRLDVADMRHRLSGMRWIGLLPGLKTLLSQFIARLDDLVNFIPLFIQTLWTIMRFRPDIIHVNNEPLCNRAAILSGRLLRIPVICHVRGNPKESRLIRWLYRLPNHFIPVSDWVSGGIGRLGVPEEKRTTIYDGIALEALDIEANPQSFRGAVGIPEDGFAVGLVGLLIPWKGQSLLLEIGGQLARAIPKLRLLLVGGTPEECRHYEQELREYVRENGLEDIVIFTGHVSDVAAMYKGLDIVVSASTSPEPLGTMVIECMAMARPLVAPNHGGAAEMTDHMGTALLFEPGNAQHLADAIIQLYRNPDQRVQLGLAARAKALCTFAVEEHVRRVQEIYEQVLDS